MQSKHTFEQVLDNVRSGFNQHYTQPKKQFIILYDGKQLTANGRSVWDEIGKAKRSLNYHVKHYLYYSDVKAHEIINELLTTGEIEFKEL